MPSLASGLRPAAIIGLLLIAGAGTTWVSSARQDKQNLLTERQPWQTEDAQPRFLIDTEGWMRSPDEHIVETTHDLSNGPNLETIPLSLGSWTGRDADVTNAETLPTLGADNFVFRQYQRGNDAVWLTSIGSTKGQSFHAPTVCYVAANWNVEDLPSQPIAVGNGQVAAHAIRATLDSGEEFIDMHWYLWTDVRREWRLGATLMRVTIPVTTTEQQALQVGSDFASNFFSRVLS
jgi:hypothetical protein